MLAATLGGLLRGRSTELGATSVTPVSRAVCWNVDQMNSAWPGMVCTMWMAMSATVTMRRLLSSATTPSVGSTLKVGTMALVVMNDAACGGLLSGTIIQASLVSTIAAVVVKWIPDRLA